MPKKLLFPLIAVLAVPMLFYAGWRFHEAIAIDRCLDAGGAWHDARHLCVGVAPDDAHEP